MKTAPIAALSLFLASPALAETADPGSAWSILDDLTTEVGQRLAGSPREAAARDWAMARLTALGFANVRSEPFTIIAFVRGAETARLTAPYPQ
ncbi:MAG: peptidase M28 family protein, partial [Novosphingobium sp.]